MRTVLHPTPIAHPISYLGMSQVVQTPSDLPIILSGDFYAAENWVDGETFWLAQNGYLTIYSTSPESLVKLSMRVFPFVAQGRPPLSLLLLQGNQELLQRVIEKQAEIDIYISVLEGLNVIDIRALGEVYSPLDIQGAPDARKLSFALQNIETKVLSA